MFTKLKGSTCIVGLSGGPDSVYLLHQLVDQKDILKLNLYVAHLDHEWRLNSVQDVLFCQSLCMQLQIPFITKKASDFSTIKKIKGSQEAYGRSLRRAFFETIKQELSADYIVLGHHADDQIETFFIRLLRGASVQGLGGMYEYAGYYVRPLLHLTKKDIISYLKSNSIAYLIDETNNSDLYLRNRIRHTVMPALLKTDDRASQKIIHTMQQLQEVEHFLEQVTRQEYLRLVDNGVLSLVLFKRCELYMQKRIIQQWLIIHTVTFTQTALFFDEILRFLVSPRGGVHIMGTWSIHKKGSYASIVLD